MDPVQTKKRSFLLVEDEALIRMMLADMLEELGHTVSAEAASLQQALSLARDAAFDVAILDINLDGADSMPVAEAVEQRGIPLLFASGYDETALPEAFKGRQILRRPFRMEQLDSALRALLIP